MSSTKVITREEVAKHNKKESGWFIVNNAVYDVSHFYDDHPGGRDILLALIGQDATEEFEGNNHSKGAYRKLDELQVGELPKSEQRTFISMKEVEGHNTATSAWFVLNNKVYDVTKFLDLHPGGRDVLIGHAGTDATQPFTDNGHSDTAYEMMKKYRVGDLEPSERKKFVNRKAHAAAKGPGVVNARTHNEDESLMGRIQEQLQLFILLAVFVMAGVFLLS